MIIFNEGLPRSGKSYDAVKTHILPALVKGRKVYARLNGLDHDKIAAHLGMDPAKVRALLTLVNTDQVTRVFQARRADTDLGALGRLPSPDNGMTPGVRNFGEWQISEELKNSLFIIDECHEFYVAGRDAINPAIEQFFALCGQNGMDGVLMTQAYRRLHSSVRLRIERKNVFQKLTAVGLENKYTLTRYHTTSPDRFEKIGTDTETYDPKIYPLYKGYADGAGNTEVYKGGGTTVWRKVGKYALLVIPVVFIGLYGFRHFFGADSGLAKHKDQTTTLHYADGVPSSGTVRTESRPAYPVKKPHGKLSEGQQYVWDLCDKTRPRLIAIAKTEGRKLTGMVEWKSEQGGPLDELTFAQLADLGVKVEQHTYGVRLSAGTDSIIVTQWPLATPVIAPPGDQKQDQQGQSSPSGSSYASGTQWPEGAGKPTYTAPGEPGSWHPDQQAARGVISTGR